MTDTIPTIPLTEALKHWAYGLRMLALKHAEMDDEAMADRFNALYRKMIEDVRTQFDVPGKVILLAVEKALTQFRFEQPGEMSDQDADTLARHVAVYLCRAEAMAKEMAKETEAHVARN